MMTLDDSTFGISKLLIDKMVCCSVPEDLEKVKYIDELISIDDIINRKNCKMMANVHLTEYGWRLGKGEGQAVVDCNFIKILWIISVLFIILHLTHPVNSFVPLRESSRDVRYESPYNVTYFILYLNIVKL